MRVRLGSMELSELAIEAISAQYNGGDRMKERELALLIRSFAGADIESIVSDHLDSQEDDLLVRVVGRDGFVR